MPSSSFDRKETEFLTSDLALVAAMEMSFLSRRSRDLYFWFLALRRVGVSTWPLVDSKSFSLAVFLTKRELT